MNISFTSKALLLTALVHCAATNSFAQNCSGTSVGSTPLTELATGMYKGFPGGLYPGGFNDRPLKHDSVGRALARIVKPINSSGAVDSANGKIVLLSIGMSNTTQEFSVFKALADKDPSKNPRLIIVDGAQGGQTASIIRNPAASFWTEVDRRLTAAGVSRQQVQAAWLKEADASPSQAFPIHALTLQTELETIVRILKTNYPNIKLTYISSRTYAGYATSSLNPEPYAYESGFSVKWMIEKQINGDTSLSYAGSNSRSPWLSWGPYLWTNGTIPRTDGLTWLCSDCQLDGTHPSPSGQTKVANLLLNFFKSDPTAASWFLASSINDVPEVRERLPVHFKLCQNYPNPFNPSTAISFELDVMSLVKLDVVDVLGREVATLVNEIYPAGTSTVQWVADRVPSGVYYYRLHVGGRFEARRMLLIR